MRPEDIQLPEYGGGGDFLGARRSRRAFRWFIALTAFFTVILWISERFLRYEHAEMLYINGIVLRPEAGRNLLRQAVREDEQNHEYPSPRYVQALAEREEPDLILPTYERAYEYDPGNWGLAMRYGVQLYEVGRAGVARARFREAGDQAPRNAMPLYLEASVIPWIDPANPNVTESLSLIARASAGERTIELPAPLWHADLPSSGYWYAELNRAIARELLAPIQRYSAYLMDSIRQEDDRRELTIWDGWLEHVQAMGAALTRAAYTQAMRPGANHAGLVILAQAGLGIELDATNARREIGQALELPANEDAIKRVVEIEAAQTMLQNFEETRKIRINADKDRYRYPLGLCFYTVALYLICALTMYAIARLARVGAMAGNVHHPMFGRAILGAIPLMYLVLLSAIAMFQRAEVGALPWMTVISITWIVLLFANISFGTIYPALVLERPSAVLKRYADRLENVEAVVRKGYRDAYLSLLKRYIGISCGWFIAVMCLWIVFYRIVLGLFPWQIELLATGLESSERELILQTLARLAG